MHAVVPWCPGASGLTPRCLEDFERGRTLVAHVASTPGSLEATLRAVVYPYCCLPMDRTGCLPHRHW
eukprot:7714657-Pyramimonas_sp.AAC.1